MHNVVYLFLRHFNVALFKKDFTLDVHTDHSRLFLVGFLILADVDEFSGKRIFDRGDPRILDELLESTFRENVSAHCLLLPFLGPRCHKF